MLTRVKVTSLGAQAGIGLSRKIIAGLGLLSYFLKEKRQSFRRVERPLFLVFLGLFKGQDLISWSVHLGFIK